MADHSILGLGRSRLFYRRRDRRRYRTPSSAHGDYERRVDSHRPLPSADGLVGLCLDGPSYGNRRAEDGGAATDLEKHIPLRHSLRQRLRRRRHRRCTDRPRHRLGLFGQRLYAEYVTEFVLAYLFGMAFQYFAIRAMRQVAAHEAIVDAIRADPRPRPSSSGS